VVPCSKPILEAARNEPNERCERACNFVVRPQAPTPGAEQFAHLVHYCRGKRIKDPRQTAPVSCSAVPVVLS